MTRGSFGHLAHCPQAGRGDAEVSSLDNKGVNGESEPSFGNQADLASGHGACHELDHVRARSIGRVKQAPTVRPWMLLLIPSALTQKPYRWA